MTSMRFPQDEAGLAAIRAIAKSAQDGPVLMLNLNRYEPQAQFSSGEIYTTYRSMLEKYQPRVSAEILWRTPMYDQSVGNQSVDEMLIAWYSTHQTLY